MKKAFALLLFGVLLLPSCQEADEHVVSDYHKNKVAQFEEENKNKTSCDVVFLGDSLTDLYDVNAFYPQWDVLNRGIGGDRTYNVLDILPISAYAVHPKVAILQIGINDIFAGRKLSSIEKDYESILKKIKENMPDCQLFIESLYPLTSTSAFQNDKVRDFNPKIEALAKKYSFPYIDMHTPLLDPQTNELKESYTLEGLHLVDAGYEVITNVLTPYIAAALA